MGISDQTLPFFTDQRVSLYLSPSVQLHLDNMLREIVCFRSQLLYWTSNGDPTQKQFLKLLISFIFIFIVNHLLDKTLGVWLTCLFLLQVKSYFLLPCVFLCLVFKDEYMS